MFLISGSIHALSLQFSHVNADPVYGMRSFVDGGSDENDPYDPATANWRYARCTYKQMIHEHRARHNTVLSTAVHFLITK